VVPFIVSFPVPFDSDLLDIHKEKFRKAKLAIEIILYRVFLLLFLKAPIAIQVISFSEGSTVANYLTIYSTSDISSASDIQGTKVNQNIANAIANLTATGNGTCNITGLSDNMTCSDIASKSSTNYDYCTGVACPTGGSCTSQSSNYTYSCNCTNGYSVSGTLSSKPLVQTCTPNYSSVTVVLAVVIPVACGIIILLLGIFVFFVVRHRGQSKKADVAETDWEWWENQFEGEPDLYQDFNIEVPQENVQYYRNPPTSLGGEPVAFA
jgi:hypothetical protein